MGYFTRADIPFQCALADAFTDLRQLLLLGPGPDDAEPALPLDRDDRPARARAGGPVIANPPDYKPVYHWTTYPERLQEAGISWQVYANDEVGDGGGNHGYVGDYGDNPLWLFQAYHDALASTDPSSTARQAGQPAQELEAHSGQGKNIDHVLAQFIADCASDTLPAVSWIVAPYAYTEHPAARPVDGAAYMHGCWRRSGPIRRCGTRPWCSSTTTRTTASSTTCRRRRAGRHRDEYVARPADRARPPRADDRRLALEPRRLGQLAGLRPHVGDPLPRDVTGVPSRTSRPGAARSAAI